MKRWLTSLLPLFLAACAQQNVQNKIAEASPTEASKYEREIDSQSPFETLTMSWSEAIELMESRNPAFLSARSRFTKANQEKPVVAEISGQVKETISGSVGQIISPSALLKSLQNPVEQLPKRISSIGDIKNVPHQLEKHEWQEVSTSLEAELAMREERVRLHHLLRKEQIINAELHLAETALKNQKSNDPKFLSALENWRNTLHEDRKTWLTQMRNVFDAEYHDLRFKPDRSGLTDYRGMVQPDLNDLNRWCHLQRTHHLVNALSRQHSKNRSALPGATLITQKFSSENPTTKLTDPAIIRKQVRSLLNSWRELKAAQQEADALEKTPPKPSLTSAPELAQRQKIYKLRTTEIHHTGILWSMDEDCWR